MCGRVHLSTDYSEIKIALKLGDDAPAQNLRPSWNTPPTQDMLVVHLHPQTHQRLSEKMRWGLILRWAREPKADFASHNTRAETLTKKAIWQGHGVTDSGA